MIDPRVQALFHRENIEQHSEKWYQVRKGLVTASEVGSILGTNPYKTRKQLLMGKVGFGDEMGRFGQTATAWGNFHEDLAADRFAQLYGLELVHFGLFLHQEHTWIGASPDRVTKCGKLLEIKCPISRRIVQNPEGPLVPMADGPHVPPYYRDQMLLLMEVLDLDEAFYMEWRPESTWQVEEVGITVVKRDREWFARSLPLMREFYDEMVALRQRPKEELEALFPPPARHGRTVAPRRQCPSVAFRHRVVEVAGLPSGEVDEFYDMPGWECPEHLREPLDLDDEEEVRLQSRFTGPDSVPEGKPPETTCPFRTSRSPFKATV